jgi:sensitive to high expression protein 9
LQVREALEKEKKFRTDDGQNPPAVEAKQNDLKLDGIVAAGVQELQEEMSDDPKNPDPAVDALATVITTATAPNDSHNMSSISDTKLPPPSPSFTKPGTWSPALLDLWSSRTISLKKQDITIIALESAATGAAFVSLIAMFVLRPN